MKQLLVLLAFALASAMTKAETIKILWPFSPSPGYSSLLRIIDHANTAQTKYEFVPDIKQGAGGTVAALHSLQNENTLFIMSTSSFITKPIVTPDGSHNITDYQPVYILLVNQPLALVSKNYTLKELLAMNKPSIAIAAAGGISDFTAKAIKNDAQSISYRSFTESKMAAAGGHTDAAITTLGEAMPLLNDGKFRLLGITGTQGKNTFRSMKISGLDNLTNDNVIFAPSSMSEDKVNEINAILTKAGNYDDVKAPLIDDAPVFVMYNLKQTRAWYENQKQFWQAVANKK